MLPQSSYYWEIWVQPFHSFFLLPVLPHKRILSDLIDTDALKKLDRDREDLDELYIFNWANADEAEDFVLVNKSGKIVDDDARSIDGEDYVYVTDGKGRIVAIYLES